MTLSTTTTRASASGNGSTVDFNFTFKVWAAADLKVYLRDTTTLVDTLQTLTTHYTVVPTTSYPDAGKITFVTAPATGKTVIILRDAAMTQDLDLIANGAFAAENVEAALDKIVGFAQSLEERDDRALILPIGSTLGPLTLPEPTVAKAGQVLGINGAGTAYQLFAATTISPISVSSFVATLIDDATAAAFFATLGVKTALSSSLNFGSLLDNGSSVQALISIPGVVAGDFAFATASGDIQSTQGVYLQCRTVTDNVALHLENDSGSTFDAAAQTFNVIVFPKAMFGF